MVSLAISFWIGLGAIFNYKPAVSSLPPLSTHLCDARDDFNVTFVTSTLMSQTTHLSNMSLHTTELPPVERSVLAVPVAGESVVLFGVSCLGC